jgi:hypothetical protein
VLTLAIYLSQSKHSGNQHKSIKRIDLTVIRVWHDCGGAHSIVKRTTIMTSSPKRALLAPGFVWKDGNVERIVKTALSHP